MTISRVSAPGTLLVGHLVDRLDLLAAAASLLGRRGALWLGLDADHVVVALGAGRLIDGVHRVAACPWAELLTIGRDEAEAEHHPEVLLCALEALYGAHTRARRLTYVPTSLLPRRGRARAPRWSRAAAALAPSQSS